MDNKQSSVMQKGLLNSCASVKHCVPHLPIKPLLIGRRAPETYTQSLTMCRRDRVAVIQAVALHRSNPEAPGILLHGLGAKGGTLFITLPAMQSLVM